MRLSKAVVLIAISVSISITTINSLFFKYDKEIAGLSSDHDNVRMAKKNSFMIIRDIEKEHGDANLGSLMMASSLYHIGADLISQLPGVHPDIVSHGDNILVVYEYIGNYRNITMQYSRDHGKTWSNALFSKGPDIFGYPFERSNQTDPDIAIRSDGQAMCVFESDDNRSNLYMLEFPDITDPPSWRVSWIELYNLREERYFYRIENLHDLAISISDDDKILIAGIGDIVNLSSSRILNQAPVIFYSKDGGDTFTIIFSEDVLYRNLRKTSASFDEGAYVTYEMESGSLCLYFPDGDLEKDWKEFVIEDRDSTIYRNPSVYTLGENVIVLIESVSYDNSDVVYFLSKDHGKNWLPGTVEVACSFDDERFPLLSYQRGKFMLSFEKNGNLYITNSVDLEEWSDPEKVNDIDGSIYSYFGFSSFGNEYGLVWSEMGEGFPIVKFLDVEKEADGGEIEGSVDLRIIESSISYKSSGERLVKNIKNILSLEIENLGSADSGTFMITAYIKYENKENQIPIAIKKVNNLKGGERSEVNLTLFYPSPRDIVKALISFVNVNSLIIKIDSDDTVVETDETNNNINLDVDYGTFFPRLVWLENFISKIFDGKELDSESVEDLVVKALGDELTQ